MEYYPNNTFFILSDVPRHVEDAKAYQQSETEEAETTLSGSSPEKPKHWMCAPTLVLPRKKLGVGVFVPAPFLTGPEACVSVQTVAFVL